MLRGLFPNELRSRILPVAAVNQQLDLVALRAFGAGLDHFLLGLKADALPATRGRPARRHRWLITIDRAVRAALESPDVKAKLGTFGLAPSPGPTEAVTN